MDAKFPYITEYQTRSERFYPISLICAFCLKARLFEGLLDFQNAPRISLQLRPEAAEEVLRID